MRRSRGSLIGAVLMAVTLVVGIVPGALAASEDSFLSKLNAERTSRGLAALESYWDLADDAEAHSREMMAAGDLYHNPNLASVTTGWAALGENVGVGPSVNSIHAAFMESAPHRANILGDYTHVGIGAVRESDNRLWVTVVFMKAAGGPSSTTTTVPPTTAAPPTTTTTIAPPPTTAPPTTMPPTTTAPPTTVAPTTTAPPAASPRTAPPSDRDEPTRHWVHLVRLHQPRPS